MPTIRYRLGVVTYEIDDINRTVRSVFPDGDVCEGVASFTDEDAARARSLGYRGTDTAACWEMHREHDLVHHVVAQALGWPYSMVLWLAAHGSGQMPVGVYQTEERMAFLVQRAMNEGRRILHEHRA